MEGAELASLLAAAAEEQHPKYVTFQATQTDELISTKDTVDAERQTIAAAAPSRAAAQADQEPATISSTTSSKKHASRKHSRKRDKAAGNEANSITETSGSESEPVVHVKHRGIKAWRHPGLQSTCSYRQLTTIGCCHQYTITGYGLAHALGPGTCLRSDVFEAGGQQFQLEVYPAGLSADTSHHLSLFLTSPGAINPNHVLWEIAVVDQSGRGRHLIRASKPQRHGPSMGLQRGVVAGYPCFVRSALMKQHQSRYLANDCLIIRATVEVVRSWSAAPQQLTMPGNFVYPTSPQQQQYTQHRMLSSGDIPAVQLPICSSPQPRQQQPLQLINELAATTVQQLATNPVPGQHVMTHHAMQHSMPSQQCTCHGCCQSLPEAARGHFCVPAAAAEGYPAYAPAAERPPLDAVATAKAAQQCGSPTHGLQQQQDQCACNCPACRLRTTSGPLKGSLVSGAGTAAGGDCTCIMCLTQKLLQLLPMLAGLNISAAGHAATGAAASDETAPKSSMGGTDSSSSVAHPAQVDAAKNTIAAQSNGGDVDKASIPAAAGSQDCAPPLACNITTARALASQLLQALQGNPMQRCTCCYCSSTSRPACSVESPERLQQRCAVPHGAMQNRAPAPQASGSCSWCEACGTVAAGQAQRQLSPVQRLHQQQGQLQASSSLSTPPTYAIGQTAGLATPAAGAVQPSSWGGECLQPHGHQAAAVAVPFVRNHPARVVYM